MPDIPYKQLIDENGDSFYPVCGASSFSDAVPIAKGGTGADNAADARTNLGCVGIVEAGTTTDNKNTVWNYRKWSNGDIDLWLVAGTFSWSGSQEGPYNGMYRRRETRSFSILTDILSVTALGVNSCMFIAGVFVDGANQITLHQQGVATTTATTSANIFIKGKWQ